eukprot:Hpha_TRINITY_DN23627_c0_g1::TRINITY_DN23627_c0_g1_i1::g.57624::m.57624
MKKKKKDPSRMDWGLLLGRLVGCLINATTAAVDDGAKCPGKRSWMIVKTAPVLVLTLKRQIGKGRPILTHKVSFPPVLELAGQKHDLIAVVAYTPSPAHFFTYALKKGCWK